MGQIKFYKNAQGTYVLTEVKGKHECIAREVLLSGGVTDGKAYFRVNPNSEDRYRYLNGEHLLADVLNEAGVPYTAEALSALFSDFFLESASELVAEVRTSGAATLKAIAVEITRPANQTPYTAGDVIGDVSGALVPILNVAKAAGFGVRITRIRIQTNDTSVAGTKFNVHVYCQAPAAIADNAPFVIDYANAVKRVGAIPVVMGVGNLGTVGMNDYNIMTCNPLTRDLYFILETVTGFTSSAASTKFTLAFDLELSNS